MYSIFFFFKTLSLIIYMIIYFHMLGIACCVFFVCFLLCRLHTAAEANNLKDYI